MKSIDERVATFFEGTVAYKLAAEGARHMACQALRRLLVEVARDQQERIEEAVKSLPEFAEDDYRAGCLDRDDVLAAIRIASIGD